MTAIRLFRGVFGHVAMLNVASDLVTHAHAEAHVIIWLDGAPGLMHVGGTAIEPGPDIAVGVNSYQPHSHAFEAGVAPGFFLAFYIHPEWAAKRFGLAEGAPLFRRPAIPLDPWLRQMSLGLFDRLAEESADLAGYEVERLVASLIDTAEPRQRPAASRQARDFRVRKAVELMRADISARTGLDALARSVGLSRPHFFALFKEQMNVTPNVYWNTLRMEEALRQLRSSDESLTTVACSLGFTTQGNFTRFFRDHAGVPPTLYREAARMAA